MAMTDKTDDSKKETLRVSRPKTLSLTKTVEGGKVKQNFSRGKSKTVTVEVKKTRTFSRGAAGSMVADKPVPRGPRGLSQAEQEARLKALQKKDEGGGTLDQTTPAVPKQEIKKKSDDKTTVTKPVKAAPVDDLAAKNMQAMRDAPKPIETVKKKDDEEKDKPKKIKLKADGQRRQSGKLTIAQALNYDEERTRSLASIKRQRAKAKKHDDDGPQEKMVREIRLPETITVQELANRMAERGVDVIKALMKLGVMATPQQAIDADTAELVIEEFGHKTKRVSDADVEDVLVQEDDKDEDLQARAPVVTIMGHVDHGKTSLLDALRQANVVAGEAGGITQHIGAYQTQITSGEKITFLDTPGHEAFTAMRARGAQATDIVVLVVAADDGIKPQTIEAINHAKAAKVPIIVAVNKIDKEGADPERVKNELMQYELVAEDFGGDIQVVPVSALEKTGLDTLQENIVLQAEMLDLKANSGAAASGIVIESKIDKGRGTVASLLVQRGTMRVGDIVVAGASFGRVRAIVNDRGENLEEAIPSQPVEILGLGEPPQAGDDFAAVDSEKTARDITEYRAKKLQRAAQVVSAKSLDQLFAAAGKEEQKELSIIIKADVHGSSEAIVGSLAKFENDEVHINIAHSAVGAISESDISLAMATGAMIVGFNVRASASAREMAAREGIQLRYYSVIYDVIDDIKQALSGLLSPELKEEILGYAEILEVFNVSKVGKVAGCKVIEGIVKRGSKVRLLRDNVVIHDGTLKTLKRFKEEVKEVKNGYECGMAFENYDDIKQGDQIECYDVKEIARDIEDAAKSEKSEPPQNAEAS